MGTAMPPIRHRLRLFRGHAWREAIPSLKSILISYPTQPVEFFGGVASIFRGIWWMTGWSLERDRVAELVARMIPTEIFGASLILLGIMQLLSLVLKLEDGRRLAATLLAGSTTMVLVSALLVEPKALVVPALTVLTLMQVHIAVRVTPWSCFPFAPKRRGE